MLEILESPKHVVAMKLSGSLTAKDIEQAYRTTDDALKSNDRISFFAEIDPSASLFNEGLGLDSIDVLELALEVSQRYGMQLRADDENNHAIFQSLRSLAAHVAQHRTK